MLIALIATLGFSSLSVVNAATPKAGSTCQKLGTTQNYKGKLFTCVKSGKKKIWDKGVTILAAPRSTPSATPSIVSEPKIESSPAPSTSPSPIATTASLPKAPTSFDDLIQNYQGISYAAWSKSREKILASKTTNINLKMLLGPTSQLTYKAL